MSPNTLGMSNSFYSNQKNDLWCAYITFLDEESNAALLQLHCDLKDKLDVRMEEINMHLNE